MAKLVWTIHPHTVVNEYYDIDSDNNSGKGEHVLAFLSMGRSEYLVAGRYIDIMSVGMEIGG